jgi:hypothetical protein
MALILHAALQDIPEIVECMEQMHSESPVHSRYPFKADDVHYVLTKVLMEKDPARQFLKIAVDPSSREVVGVVGAEVIDDIWSMAKVTGAHLMYVKPGAPRETGLDLIGHYLDWARKNADRIETQINAGIDDERVGQLMEAYGLAPRGRIYGQEF